MGLALHLTLRLLGRSGRVPTLPIPTTTGSREPARPPQAGSRSFYGRDKDVPETRNRESGLGKARLEPLPIADIAFSGLGYVRSCFRWKFANDFPRNSNHERVVRDHLALTYESIRSYDAIGPDDGTIQYSGSHTDQGIVLDRAAMQDRIVADSTVSSNCQREPHIRMENAPVLHV